MSLKIIGWCAYKSNDFLTLEKEKVSKEVLECIKEEIKASHYVFNASDHLNRDCCSPVLSCYKKVQLSFDEFNKIMKEINDDLNKEYKYPAYPSGEKTLKERKDIYLKHQLTPKAFKNVAEFYKESDGDLNHLCLYLLPLKMDDKYHYWIEDRLMLYTSVIQDKIYTRVLKIYSFNDLDDFKLKIKDIIKNEPLCRMAYSLSEVKKVSDKPFILLGLNKVNEELYLNDIDIIPNEISKSARNSLKCKNTQKR